MNHRAVGSLPLVCSAARSLQRGSCAAGLPHREFIEMGLVPPTGSGWLLAYCSTPGALGDFSPRSVAPVAFGQGRDWLGSPLRPRSDHGTDSCCRAHGYRWCVPAASSSSSETLAPGLPLGNYRQPFALKISCQRASDSLASRIACCSSGHSAIARLTASRTDCLACSKADRYSSG